MPSPRQRTWIAASAGAIAAVVVVAAIVSALDAARIAQPPVSLGIIRTVCTRLSGASRARPENRVVLLTNSTGLSGAPGGHLDQRLARAIASIAPDRPVRPVPLLYPGLDALNYYALVDRIAATHPRLVILAFGLTEFSPARRDHYPELAGWIAPNRLGNTLGLPLEHYGLTIDRLLLYVGLVKGGMVDVWSAVRSEQARVGKAWEQLQNRLTLEEQQSAMVRLRATIGFAHLYKWMQKRNVRRFNRAGAMRGFEAALNGVPPHHPVLRLLEATVAFLTDRGIATLVYIIPVNVEHLATLGIDTTAFAATIATVDTTVRAAGGHLIDLHGSLPDEAFRDANHFDVAGKSNGLDVVAATLAPRVLAILHPDDSAR